MAELRERLDEILAPFRPLNVGEGHAAVRAVRNIQTNAKPNPKRLFVAEGFWLASLALRDGLEVDTLLVSPECVYTPECVALIEKTLPLAKNIYTVSEKVFRKIAEKDKPDGVIAICPMKSWDLSDLSFDDKAVALILDGIEIPGNMGTLVRVADGAFTARVDDSGNTK